MSESSNIIIELLEAERKLEALQRRRIREAAFGLLGYQPHMKQDLFHSAAKYKRRYYRSGNRGGKSTCGVAETCAFALGYRPWYEEEFDVLRGDLSIYRHHNPAVDGHLIHEGLPQRSCKILIICADWDKAEEIFTNPVEGQGKGKLFRMLPKDKIVAVIKNQSGRIAEIQVASKWGGVSTITLDTVKSYKSNPMGQESGDFDVIHVDEPCPEKMFKANARGLIDRDGCAYFTCTPLTEMWINDLFLPSGMIEVGASHVHTKEVDGCNIETWMTVGSMHDNPHLTRTAKAQFISELTEDEIETRVDGRPAALTGAIYKTFKRDYEPNGHIYSRTPGGWTDFDEPSASCTVRCAIDTHPVTPCAVLFCATVSTGHTFFWGEIFAKLHPKELAALILQRLGGREPQRTLLELAAYNEDAFGGITMADEFIQGGVPNIMPAVKDLQYGIMRVNQELAKRDSHGRPYLLFHESLHETLREFDRYVWDADKGRPVDRDDHMMENLYRLVLTGLEYISPEAVEYKVKVPDPAHYPVNLPMVLSLPGQYDPRTERTTLRRSRYPHSRRANRVTPSLGILPPLNRY